MGEAAGGADQLGEGVREEFVVLRVQHVHVLCCLLLGLHVVHRTERDRLVGALSKYLNGLARRLLGRGLLTDEILTVMAVMLKNVSCRLSIRVHVLFSTYETGLRPRCLLHDRRGLRQGWGSLRQSELGEGWRLGLDWGRGREGGRFGL